MSDLPVDDFLGDVESSNGSATDFFEQIEYDAPVVEETPPHPFEGATSPVGDGQCESCGAPTFRPPGLTASGRKKRVPKFCDLHLPNVRVQTERPNLKGVESQLQRIQEELADDIKLAGMMMGTFFPVTGMYMITAADPFTIAVIKLSKNNQSILRVLHRAAQVAPIYTVAETLAGTAYSVQVDLKKADPHGAIARRLKVDRAYDEIFSEEVNGPPVQDFSPPRYSTVR